MPQIGRPATMRADIVASRPEHCRVPRPPADRFAQRGPAGVSTYEPGAGSSAGCLVLPAASGAGRFAPPCRASQSPQCGHQLPGRLSACASQSSASSAGALVDPVIASHLLRRVDDAGDVAGRTERERHLAAEERGRPVGGMPRHDVIVARGVHVGGHRHAREVDGLSGHRQRPGLAQPVVEVEIAQVIDVHRAWQVRRVAVPVQEVEGRRRFALEVIVDDVVPDEVVGAEAREGAGELGAVHALPREQRRLARRQQLARHIDADLARIREVEHRREEGRARDAAILARGEHRQRAREEGPAHAEAERVHGPGCRRSVSPPRSPRARPARGSRPSQDARARAGCCATRS